VIEKMLNSPLAQWLDERSKIVQMTRAHLIDYPTPKNLNYMWSFGSIALVILVLQILSGIFLAMFYKPSAEMTTGGFTVAFDSVERIMRDVNFGWLIRYIHAVGASAFFFVIYLHFARGLYYGSFKRPRELLWAVGVIILLVMQASAFFGYLLPWGQMSYWGATVITNLFGSIPVVGNFLLHLLRGGFGVGDPTINRFFPLHFLFPLILVAIVVMHIHALHVVHSNNPTGVDLGKKGAIPFHPYFTVKDAFGIGVFLIIFAWFLFFNPTGWGLFMEPDNFSPANGFQTPPHIAPVWYLTPWYSILRAFPDKLMGVIAMGLSMLLLFFIPWLDRGKVRSARYRPAYRQMVLLFFLSVLVLGYCGHTPPNSVLIVIGRIATAVYFGFFLFLPFVTKREKTLPVPEEL
jgi:ubiquinol-cytochrome c reductase cytochrome b subunit